MRETSRVTGTCSGVTTYDWPPKSKPSSGSARSKRRPSPERRWSRPRSKVSERPAMHLTVPAGRGRSAVAPAGAEARRFGGFVEERAEVGAKFVGAEDGEDRGVAPPPADAVRHRPLEGVGL